MPKELPSPETLRKLLRYDPATGKLFWRERGVSLFKQGFHADRWNKRYAGTEAFATDNGDRYRIGHIFNKKYRAHRIIWAMYYGSWPEFQIDHINGDPADNRIKNLREVSNVENAKNRKRSSRNTSGVTGVYWSKKAGKWQACIGHEGDMKHLGLFTCLHEAAEARREAEVRFGFHKNHGRVTQ